MIDKDILFSHVSKLLELAYARSTQQGVVVYAAILEKLKHTSSQDEVNDCAYSLQRALNGIEAHGYFTQEEYGIVKAVRELR